MPKGRTIEQFMWGYQHLFRSSVTHKAEFALDSIGFQGSPKALVIGLQVAGQHTFSVCIEPEDGPYEPGEFADVKRRAAELYEQHDDRRSFHSDPGMHETFHRRLRNRMTGEAITEVLRGHPASDGREFFFGGPTRVGDYKVFVIVHVAQSELAKVPRLQSTKHDRFDVFPSLVHSLVDEILYRASMNLFIPNAGADLDVVGIGTPELVRSATNRFVRGVLLRAGSMFGEDHDQLFSAISALPYEGRSGVGRIVIGDPDRKSIEPVLTLQQPVEIRNTRAVRKLVEASTDKIGLLMHDAKAYGLGNISKNYDAATESAFEVALLGRGAWDLNHDGQTLLSVRDGIARLPVNVLDVDKLLDNEPFPS